MCVQKIQPTATAKSNQFRKLFMRRNGTVGRTTNPLGEEDDDPMAKTGCQALNEAVLLCFDAHKDWRQCQKEIKAFKACFEAYTSRTKQGQSSN